MNTVTMQEMVAMKKEMTVELLKARFKGLAIDMTATITYLEESIAWLNNEIQKEEMAMNKRTVIGVGRIVNGRITYVSTQGGVSRPVAMKGQDFDGEPEVLEGEVLDVRFPVAGTEQPTVGADWDEVLDVEQPRVRFTEARTGCDWVEDKRDYDAYDLLFGRTRN